MNSAKSYLIALLTLATVGGMAVAWRQYQELVELRAGAMNKDERADLQKRVWSLEKLNRELQDQLATLRGERTEATEAVLAAASADRPPASEDGRGGRGRGGRGPGDGLQQMTAIRDLMAKPEVQALVSVQQKAAIEARYASLFRNLNLPPEQLDKLKNLLIERQTTVQDVLSAAFDQGVDPRTDPAGFRKLISDAQNVVNNGIKSVLGDAGFSQLQNYEQTLPQRNLVTDLQQRLSHTNTPLTSAQAEQLVQILAANAPQRVPNNPVAAGGPPPPPGGRGPGGGFGGGGYGDAAVFVGRGGDIGGAIVAAFGGGGGPGGNFVTPVMDGGRGGATAPVTSAAIAQAQTILAPSQLSALQQIQQQQQSQQQLQQLIRETMSAGQPAPGDRGRGPPGGGTTTGGIQNRRPGGGG
ncbi:MAG: hypothetical protein HY736_10060 [Verrucomicrobia bacterium]|nr:hypothetical protein [Verrucomicrobiota bacterium]